MNKADAALLVSVAERAMVEKGFLPFPPPAALAEAAAQAGKPLPTQGIRDLRSLPWTSIDNPESRDLDQIEVLEPASGGTKVYVGIADLDHCVPPGSANDRFAGNNTVSVYTGVRTFPMLPEKFSFDLTSLLAGQPRLVVVIETLISNDGKVQKGSLYPALAENKAKLDYISVSAWLEGKSPPPPGLAEAPELQKQVRLQDALAQKLAEGRKTAGALYLDTHETRLVTDSEGVVTGIAERPKERAGSIIEELMIASNTTLARELDARGQPSIRRIVREPERWARIVAYAAGLGTVLPQVPSSVELSRFADKMRAEKPERFGEISLALVKLIGRGEYAAHKPGAPEIGHFGLAALAYTHATAPNRRYADLVTQRIVKKTRPYTLEELTAVAARCTQMEDAANKVERRVNKAGSALLLRPRIGEVFKGCITGVGPKGTFVRLLELPVDGMLVSGEKGLDVGDSVRVKLRSVNVEHGYIDLEIA
jgi:VacB/RNase II family 3'-5' exoribonuclease